MGWDLSRLTDKGTTTPDKRIIRKRPIGIAMHIVGNVCTTMRLVCLLGVLSARLRRLTHQVACMRDALNEVVGRSLCLIRRSDIFLSLGFEGSLDAASIRTWASRNGRHVLVGEWGKGYGYVVQLRT